MTLDDAIEKAAKELPEGASMTLDIEEGYAGISAMNWDGDPWEGEVADKSIVEQILEALQWCIDTDPIAP